MNTAGKPEQESRRYSLIHEAGQRAARVAATFPEPLQTAAFTIIWRIKFRNIVKDTEEPRSSRSVWS